MDETMGSRDPPGPPAPLSRSKSMSEEEQRQRRENIKGIMNDNALSASEKRRSIQSLMDGRRRSSTTGGSVTSASSSADGSAHEYVSSMAQAAAAAAEYYSESDDDGDMVMSDTENDDDYDYDQQHLQQIPDNVLFVGGGGSRRASASTAGGDSSISQHSNPSLGYGSYASRRGSISSSARTDSGQENDESAQNHDLLQGLDDDQSDAQKRFRRYGRSRSLQDFGDGAFAAAAAAAASFVKNDPRATNKRMERSRPKCEHYERECTIVSPCCGLAFGCRICHDECPVLPPPLSASKQKQLYDNDDEHDHDDEAAAAASAALDAIEGATKKSKVDRRRSMPIDLEEEETHHEIDRFAIREVICRRCFTRQSSKTNNCISCGIQLGRYHCIICNLWMSDQESPYHCSDCGFCRVGGRENFRHCDDCGMCIDALLFDDHNCKVGKYMSNCPVCQEDLFSSRYASHEMPCGHAIHWHCFKELTSYDTRCPVCKKTAETADQMAATWSAMAMGIALQPVPADLARVVTILCYDCEKQDENRRWHFLGVRCIHCLSFNTTVERTTMMGRDAAAFLDEIDAQREQNGETLQNNDYNALVQQQQMDMQMQMQGMNMMGHHPGAEGDDNDDDDFMDE